MNPKVDAFMARAKNWSAEMKKLRAIMLDCPLTEELKWGKPCYAFEGTNLVVIQGFKEYCALLFFKGMLLSDPEDVLQKTGENTRVGRQLRFTDGKEIAKMKATIKAYVYEAIEIEKAGLKVPAKETSALKLPDEFKNKLAKNASLKAAFYKLTPGRQRAYGIYFSGAKQSTTREARIDKYLKHIMSGKGIMDR